MNSNLYPINYSRHKYNKGLSIIELMIAIAIGLFLTLGLTQLFINSRQGTASVSETIQLQENARLALWTMERIISEAGFQAKLPTSAQSFYLGCYATNNSNIFKAYNFGYGISPQQCAGWTLSNPQTNSLPTTLLFGFYNFDQAQPQTNCNTQEIVDFFASPTILADPLWTCNANQPGIPAYAATTYLVNPGGSINYSYYGYAIYGAKPNPKVSQPLLTDYIYGQSGSTLLASDSISVNLYGKDPTLGEDPILDCLGRVIPANTLMNIKFSVDANKNLICTMQVGTATPSTHTLLEGVNVMKIIYGEDLQGNGVPSRYIPAPSKTQLTSFSLPGKEVFSIGTPYMVVSPYIADNGSAYTSLDARTVCESVNGEFATLQHLADTLPQESEWCTPGWILRDHNTDALAHISQGQCSSSTGLIVNTAVTATTRARVHCYAKKPKRNQKDPKEYIIMQDIAPFSDVAQKEKWYQSGSYIINARIAILAQTQTNLLSQADRSTYNLFNNLIAASSLAATDQRKIRKLFFTTVRLKNVSAKP